MFESLKSLVQSKVTSPVERRFDARQAYNQGDPNRSLQLLFFKLLMAVAAADDQVTTEELNLLKDFAFEYSLTEQEWAEIQYYARAHLSKNELEQLIEIVASEIRSRSDREQFERAIGEMLEADSILRGGEKEIADIVHADVKRVHTSGAAYVYKTLRVAWRKRLQLPAAVASLEDEAKVYGRNPVAALLHREGVMPAGSELAGAKLGLMVLVIRSDESVDQKETAAFERYVADECRISLERAARLTKQLLGIPEELLQLTYLARTLVHALGAAERQQYFEQLVQIAQADGIQVFEGGRTLEMVARYLYLAPGRQLAP
jgi:uncharacterized tellurite resistance protein B-like protein